MGKLKATAKKTATKANATKVVAKFSPDARYSMPAPHSMAVDLKPVPAKKSVPLKPAKKTVPLKPAKKTVPLKPAKKSVPLKPAVVKPAAKKAITNNNKSTAAAAVANDATNAADWLANVSIKPLKPYKKSNSGFSSTRVSEERQSFFDSHGLKTQTQIELPFCIAGLALHGEIPPWKAKMSPADVAKWEKVCKDFAGDEDSDDEDEDGENHYDYDRFDRVISFRELGPFLPYMKYYTEKEAEELIKNSYVKY